MSADPPTQQTLYSELTPWEAEQYRRSFAGQDVLDRQLQAARKPEPRRQPTKEEEEEAALKVEDYGQPYERGTLPPRDQQVFLRRRARAERKTIRQQTDDIAEALIRQENDPAPKWEPVLDTIFYYPEVAAEVGHKVSAWMRHFVFRITPKMRRGELDGVYDTVENWGRMVELSEKETRTVFKICTRKRWIRVIRKRRSVCIQLMQTSFILAAHEYVPRVLVRHLGYCAAIVYNTIFPYSKGNEPPKKYRASPSVAGGPRIVRLQGYATNSKVLAQRLGMHERAIRRALAFLEALGMIRWDRQKCLPDCRRYYVTLPWLRFTARNIEKPLLEALKITAKKEG